MKNKLNNQYVKWGATLVSVVIISVFFIYLVYNGKQFADGIKSITSVLTPIVSGFIIAYLLTPILNYIEYKIIIPIFNFLKINASKKRSVVSRGLSILITEVLFFGIIYLLISMFISQIIPSIINIVNNFDSYISNATKWIDKLFLNDYPEVGAYVNNLANKYSTEFENWFNETVLTKTSTLIKTVSLSIIGIFKALWNFIIGLIISIYVLLSKDKFSGQAKKITYALFEQNFANILINNFKFIHNTFIGFVSGKFVDSLIIGMLCFIGTTLMNTPYAALVSVIVGITNFIPFFGPYLGAIPSTLLIFLVAPTKPMNCVYFIIFILFLQQVDGNIIGPKILGETTGLSGFWVIFSITLFGGIFGIPGMILGVPIFAVIYAAFKAYVNALLIRKNIPTDSSKYINVSSINGNVLTTYIPQYQLKKGETNHNSQFGKDFLSGKDLDNDTMQNIDITNSAEAMQEDEMTNSAFDNPEENDT